MQSSAETGTVFTTHHTLQGLHAMALHIKTTSLSALSPSMRSNSAPECTFSAPTTHPVSDAKGCQPNKWHL